MDNLFKNAIKCIKTWASTSSWKLETLAVSSNEYYAEKSRIKKCEKETNKLCKRLGDFTSGLSTVQKMKIAEEIIDSLWWDRYTLLYYRPLQNFVKKERRIRRMRGLKKELLKQFVIGVLYRGYDPNPKTWDPRQYTRPSIKYALKMRKGKVRTQQVLKLIKRGDAGVWIW